MVINADGQLGTGNGGGGGGVTSWSHRTGDVLPQLGDYSFPLLSGLLGDAQLRGTYSNAVTLSNPSNVYYGNGSNLAGVVPGPGSQHHPKWDGAAVRRQLQHRRQRLSQQLQQCHDVSDWRKQRREYRQPR